MARCKSCGVELRTGARFCDMCGAKVEKICPNCGEVLRAQAKFCDLCGEKLPLAQLISRPKVHGDICAGRLHTVALKEDGTLLATGDNQFGQCNVADWTDVVAVAAGKYHTVAVRSDGTALATRWACVRTAPFGLRGRAFLVPARLVSGIISHSLPQAIFTPLGSIRWAVSKRRMALQLPVSWTGAIFLGWQSAHFIQLG